MSGGAKESGGAMNRSLLGGLGSRRKLFVKY